MHSNPAHQTKIQPKKLNIIFFSEISYKFVFIITQGNILLRLKSRLRRNQSQNHIAHWSKLHRSPVVQVYRCLSGICQAVRTTKGTVWLCVSDDIEYGSSSHTGSAKRLSVFKSPIVVIGLINFFNILQKIYFCSCSITQPISLSYEHVEHSCTRVHKLAIYTISLIFPFEFTVSYCSKIADILKQAQKSCLM